MFKQFSTQAIIDRALNGVFSVIAPQANFYDPPALERSRPSKAMFSRRPDPTGKHAAFLKAHRENPLNYLPTRVVDSCLRNTKTQLAAERMGYKILCDMAKQRLLAAPTPEMQAKYGKFQKAA